MTAEAVLLAPYQTYAGLYIERLYRDHGIRTIALHRRWRTRLILEPRLPILHSKAVSAHYMLPPGGIAELVPMLRDRHDVVAVLPHDEGAVQPLADLAAALDLNWAQPDVLPYFGSKYDLKQLIARNDPALRVNRIAEVRDPDSVSRWLADTGVRRFVLKPDDGSGNRGVAFFDADVAPELLVSYFEEAPGRILAEEFIGGAEYWVNGQVDHNGNPVVTAIGYYDRRELNGKENVEFGGRTIPTHHPQFGALRTYAERVLRATGLRRSPFHLEAKIDEDGPCLIEVGARLCGDLFVLADSWQHGPQADLIGAAVQGYVSSDPQPPLDVNWRQYDSQMMEQVNGWSTRQGMLGRVDGVAEAESLPGFLFWIKEPHVGDIVVPTLDLVVKPWGLAIFGATDAELDERAAAVRDTIELVMTPDLAPGLLSRLPAYGSRLGRYWSARPRPYMLPSVLAERRDR